MPSPHDHYYRHHHHHPSGVSGAPSASAAASTGPYGISNSTAGPTASEAGTASGGADSVYSTAYETLQSTIYLTATAGGPSESAAADSTCGGTVTVTNANTVTVTVGGGSPSESAIESTPQTSAAVTAATAPLVSSVPSLPASLAPVGTSPTAPEVSVAASSTPAVRPVAPISVKPLTSTPVSQTPVSQTPVSQTPVSQAPSVAPSSPAPAASSAPTQPQPDTATTPLCPAAASALALASGQYQAPASPPGSKRGLFIPETAGTSTDYVKAFNANPGKISWIVNQFSGPPSEPLGPSFSYVPQCYDKFSDESKPGEAPHPWTTNAQKAVAAGEKYFLSFGEANTPNDQGFQQSPDEAASNFMTMLQPYAKDVTIGSPGTLAQCDDVTWQIQILESCLSKGCSIGFVAAHWFSPAGSASAQKLADTFWGTINQYKQIAQKFGLKVWVDNFSLDGPSDVQKEFFDIVVPQMDADDMIERYGYVSITDVSQPNGFLNGDGSISDLGLHYATM